jgi:hypothetical protein
MEAVLSCRSVNFYQITRCHVPDNNVLEV